MSYQIHATEIDGTSQIVSPLLDIVEAQKRLKFIRETHGMDNLLIKSPTWVSIELYRVELISVTHLTPVDEP